jgi:exodeoxyribonuclease VII small subunit
MAKKNFEQSLKQLELIVAELESGELPLEQALKKFEEGMELSKFCAQKLDETERKITLLMQDNARQPVEKPFPPEDQGQGAD